MEYATFRYDTVEVGNGLKTRNNWNKFEERRIRKRETTGTAGTTGTSLKNEEYVYKCILRSLNLIQLFQLFRVLDCALLGHYHRNIRSRMRAMSCDRCPK